MSAVCNSIPSLDRQVLKACFLSVQTHGIVFIYMTCHFAIVNFAPPIAVALWEDGQIEVLKTPSGESPELPNVAPFGTFIKAG